jgi:hypothetical protein
MQNSYTEIHVYLLLLLFSKSNIFPIFSGFSRQANNFFIEDWIQIVENIQKYTFDVYLSCPVISY